MYRGPDREQLASLLQVLATPDLAEDLLTLLTDRAEEHWVRVFVQRALTRLKCPPSLQQLQALVDEGFLSLSCRSDEPEPYEGLTPGPTVLLEEWGRLITTLELTEWIMQQLGERTATERADLLYAVAYHDTPLARALHEQWVNADRRELDQTEEGSGLNLKVAGRTADRPESQEWLAKQWWLVGPDQQRSIRGTLVYHDAWTLDPSEDPEVWSAAAQALALPVKALLRELGAEELNRRLGEALDQANQAIRLRTVRHHWQAQGWKALDLLAQWEEGADLVVDLIADSETVPLLRRRLVDTLWKQSRERAREWALQLAQASDPQAGAIGVPLIGRVLVQVANDPVPEDRPLLEWALGRGEAGFRALALEGLETLGGGENWETTLRALSRAQDWRVAIRAAGALVSRGDAAQEAYLVERVRLPQNPEEAAEAVRMLARFAQDRHASLFSELVTKSPRQLRSPDRYHAPVVEEAAYALLKIGDDDALTALVQAYLAIPGNAEQTAFEIYVAILTQTETDPQTPFQRVHRKAPRRGFRWLPEGAASEGY